MSCDTRIISVLVFTCSGSPNFRCDTPRSPTRSVAESTTRQTPTKAKYCHKDWAHHRTPSYCSKGKRYTTRSDWSANRFQLGSSHRDDKLLFFSVASPNLSERPCESNEHYNSGV
eukprot:c16590_g1_i3.p1 GENE.c16590_g1_i3~~c16590_g1_i3.p1  ORF type:complete len:115 (-),score=10.76 c16590_g1_i3:310-654(-)